MGIFRSAGVGLFLLFTVSFVADGSYEFLAEGEQQRFLAEDEETVDLSEEHEYLEKLARFNQRLQALQYPLIADNYPDQIYTGKLGEELKFKIAALPGKSWTFLSSTANLQIGEMSVLYPSEHRIIPSLLIWVVVPTKIGNESFRLKYKKDNDPSVFMEKTYPVRVSYTAAQNAARAAKATRLGEKGANHHYLAGEDVLNINNVVVGQKLVLLWDAIEARPPGASFREPSSYNLRIRELEIFWHSPEKYIPHVFACEVVATDPGRHWFQVIIWKNGKEVGRKAAYVEARLGSIVFVGGRGYNTREVETAVDNKVTFYAAYKTGDAGWRLDESKTSSSLTVTGLEESTYFTPAEGYTSPIKSFDVTPTEAGIYNLELKYDWINEGVPSVVTRSIKIEVR